MLPFTSDLNFTPSSTALSAPASTVPGTVVLVQIVRVVGAAATVMLNCLDAICWGAPPSATCTVNVKVAAAEGVPLICPADVKVRPVGKVPLDTVQVYGAVLRWPPARSSTLAQQFRRATMQW